MSQILWTVVRKSVLIFETTVIFIYNKDILLYYNITIIYGDLYGNLQLRQTTILRF